MYNSLFKNFFLFAILSSLFVSATAQNVETTTITTGTKILKPSMYKNFRKFSIGINVGALNPAVAIGGSNDFTNPKTTIGYGANIKYQLTHYFALQADVVRGNLKGDQSKPYYKNGPQPSERPVYSFNTDLHYAASIGGVFTYGWLNEKKIAPYISAGAGLAEYSVKIVKRGTTTEVPYQNSDKNLTEFFVPVGMGLRINLSTMINLDLGYRMHFTDGDNLDGTRIFPFSYHKDKFQYGFLGIEFSLGNKSRQQLIFYNPLLELNNKVYSLENRVDSLNTRLNLVDSDIDGDGILDKLDKEPNTPPGCPVDSHGVSLDSDGDGVPDCRDKEKVTPTFCQPVDADGVGKCPPPECCANMSKNNEAAACAVGDLPSLSFKGNSNALSADAKSMLATVASKIKVNANCNITINGYHTASKASQSLCNRRVDAVKNYLIETEGISSNRINTNCEVGNGDANIVDIRSN